MASNLDELILRARDVAQRFDNQARQPIVVEFAGCPKAGKTSTISQVAAFFKRSGLRVEVVIERASVCPIRDKKHSNFNVWTGCTTLAQLLEKTQDPPRVDDPQLLILDRGLFDSVCWLRMMERLARIRAADRERIESFLLIDDWRKRLSGVVLMLASPADSMDREKGLLPVPNSRGSIMNPDVLEQMRTTNQETADSFRELFRIMTVDTSAKPYRGKQKETCESIVDGILCWIEEHISEDILFLPCKKVFERFGVATTTSTANAQQLVDDFSALGEYRPRAEVESNSNWVQALPVAIVRNQSGQVLQLRRKERDPKNPLNEKIVLWAGGHVRKEDHVPEEDAVNGDTLRYSLTRELHEELRLDVEWSDLKLLGCVYTPNNGKSAKHVAIVYEWRAKTDDVAVSLSASEFYERRGTSLSGTFVSVDELQRAVVSKDITESWSVEIIQNLLAETKNAKNETLF